MHDDTLEGNIRNFLTRWPLEGEGWPLEGEGWQEGEVSPGDLLLSATLGAVGLSPLPSAHIRGVHACRA